MQTPLQYRSARELPWLLGLCIVTWIAALPIAGYGIWQLLQGATWEGIRTVTYAVVAVAAGIQMYRINSSGPLLFGLLVMRIQIELADFVRDSIPDLARHGRYELAGNILYAVIAIAMVALSGFLMYEIMRYTQPSIAWRPSKRTGSWWGGK